MKLRRSQRLSNKLSPFKLKNATKSENPVCTNDVGAVLDCSNPCKFAYLPRRKIFERGVLWTRMYSYALQDGTFLQLWANRNPLSDRDLNVWGTLAVCSIPPCCSKNIDTLDTLRCWIEGGQYLGYRELSEDEFGLVFGYLLLCRVDEDGKKLPVDCSHAQELIDAISVPEFLEVE